MCMRLASKVKAKCRTRADLMRAGSEIDELPIAMRSMVLWHPLSLAYRWKNLVFLFPSANHLMLDFCFQCISSACNRLCKFALAQLSSLKVESDGMVSMEDWMHWIASYTLLMFCRRLPKSPHHICIQSPQIIKTIQTPNPLGLQKSPVSAISMQEACMT